MTAAPERPLGDMDPVTFRRAGHELVEWVAQYLAESDHYPILPRLRPGEIRAALPDEAPEEGEPIEAILADFERAIVPGLTHWNHPGFFGYFAISASGPGVLAELLAAALNQQAMLWRTSPAATELEEVVLGWLRSLLRLPPVFEGVIYDTASISSLHALAAAREASVPEIRVRGLPGRDLPPLRVYCSEEAHSSIDKAVMLLGLGQNGLLRIPVDAAFRMRPEALADAVRADRARGVRPVAVVATVGTTSTTSVDPVPAVADICEAERVWLHIDAAYGGPAAMVPDCEWIFDGVARADSVVVNPHKWLFTPFDLSACYCRRMDAVRAAFALTPDYLQTREHGAARNLMDTGIQLGRRFRALKLWFVLRYFGAAGVRRRLADHIQLARRFAAWVDADPDFERLAPVPLSVVCFRAHPRALGDEPRRIDSDGDSVLDALNTELLDRVNASGEVFLSHTRIGNRVALRLAIGHLRTTEVHVARAWVLLRAALHELLTCQNDLA
ncbi:MAG: amino acid decarboxylase [Luteitalea sp.]|nr:amino acid decarboxylase [Luteitalea sp.]